MAVSRPIGSVLECGKAGPIIYGGDDGPVTSGALPDFALMHSSMAPADPDGDWSRIIEQMCRAIAYDWNAWAQWLRDNHWTPPDTPSYDDAHDPLSGGAKAQSESLSVP